MKIAFIFNDLSNTGTNIATRDLIYQLKKSHDIDVDVYFLRAVNDEIDVFAKKTQIKFFTRIDFSIYDIVHSSTLRSDFFVSLNKMFRNKRIKTKFVTSVHSIIKEDLTYTYGKFISRLISPLWLNVKRNNDAIIVSSDSMYAYYKSIFKNKNLSIIQYGRSISPITDFLISDDDKQIILKLKSKFKIIGTVGSLIKRKNYVAVIDLLKRHEDFAWVCLGLGEEFENLKKLLKENDLDERVAFLGFKTDSRPYYKYFDLFFHPSRSEGFALVIIDAMSHEKPMLLAELDVYKSIIKDNMAFYFKLDDQESLNNAFEKINEDGVFVAKAVEKSFEIYKSNFSIEVYGLKHYNVFCDLLRL
jgi:glycosyltransferase involved in cell wall biosynthesis